MAVFFICISGCNSEIDVKQYILKPVNSNVCVIFINLYLLNFLIIKWIIWFMRRLLKKCRFYCNIKWLIWFCGRRKFFKLYNFYYLIIKKLFYIVNLFAKKILCSRNYCIFVYYQNAAKKLAESTILQVHSILEGILSKNCRMESVSYQVIN